MYLSIYWSTELYTWNIYNLNIDDYKYIDDQFIYVKMWVGGVDLGLGD